MYQLSSQLINDANNKKHKVSLILVDLPGYGFAYASPEAASLWKDLMQHYLVNRDKALKRILLLVDARHGMKKADFDFLESLELCNTRRNLPPIQIVLTKCDLVTQSDLARRVFLVRQQLSDTLRRETSLLPVMLTSAKDAGFAGQSTSSNTMKGGLLELQRDLAALVHMPN